MRNGRKDAMGEVFEILADFEDQLRKTIAIHACGIALFVAVLIFMAYVYVKVS